MSYQPSGNYGNNFSYQPPGQYSHPGGLVGCENQVSTQGQWVYLGDKPGESVGPAQALKNLFSRAFQFKGRASHSEYWWIVLFDVLILILTLVSLLFFATRGFGNMGAISLIGFMYILYSIIFFIPKLSLTVRRLHDVDVSGFAVLVFLIPYVGFIHLLTLCLLPSSPRGAAYDL